MTLTIRLMLAALAAWAPGTRTRAGALAALGAWALTAAAPAPAASLSEYPLPDQSRSPFGIASGPDGNLWFTEQGSVNVGTLQYAGGKIGRITPSGAIAEYTTPTQNAAPQAIARGPDGALWFTEAQGNRIGRIDPRTASPGTSQGVSEYTIPTARAGALGIATGPDGALWFVESGAGKIGRLDPAQAAPGTTNGISEFALAPGSGPQYIAAGPDGALWFTEFSGNRIGRITTTGALTERAPPTRGNPEGIAVGPDQAIWFTQANGQRIDRLPAPYGDSTPITEYGVSGNSSNPGAIAAGPDGALWFAEPLRAVIGRIATDGTITETNLSSSDRQPAGIVGGPDGAIWFTDTAGFIGRIGLAGRPPPDQQTPANRTPSNQRPSTTPTGPSQPGQPARHASSVTCRSARRRARAPKGAVGPQVCTVRFVSPRARVTVTVALTRGRVVYARAHGRVGKGRVTLRVRTRRFLRAGRYTLTISFGSGRHAKRVVETVVIS